MNTTDPVAFWDDVYAARSAAGAPQPNARLTETVGELPPGRALDLGCGEGGDALWLARQGWHVTAVDISAVVVERLAALAHSEGLGERLTSALHDLNRSLPHGRFDLVCAHYLHTPFELDRASVLRAAALALRPGGRLLVVDHGSTAPWSWNQDPGVRYPGPRDVAEGIGLPSAEWTVERADSPRRVATGPEGRTAEVTDHVLLIRRSVPPADRPHPGAAGSAASGTAPGHRRDTPPPRTGSGEAAVLRGFLDYLRTSIAGKVEGAPEPGVRRPAVDSGTTLLGLLHHLTCVERAVFLGEAVADWESTLKAPEEGVAVVVARYREATAQADAVLDGCDDLGAPLPRPRPGGSTPAVRWALTHMIEETGRHAGQADILRELLDGATGR